MKYIAAVLIVLMCVSVVCAGSVQYVVVTENNSESFPTQDRARSYADNCTGSWTIEKREVVERSPRLICGKDALKDVETVYLMIIDAVKYGYSFPAGQLEREIMIFSSMEAAEQYARKIPLEGLSQYQVYETKFRIEDGDCATYLREDKSK